MKETGGETERYKDAERQEKGELSPPGASWMFVCRHLAHSCAGLDAGGLKEFASRYKSGTNRLEFSADMWAALNKTRKLVWRW